VDVGVVAQQSRVRADAGWAAQAKAVEARAKAHFGVTADITRAGYVTPDGSLLDFQRVRERIYQADGIEHTAIGDVLPPLTHEEQEGEDPAINRAMELGMARIAVEGRGLSVTVVRPLTVAQMECLRRAATQCSFFAIGVDDGQSNALFWDGAVTPSALQIARIMRDANMVAERAVGRDRVGRGLG
jgi:prepilin-type processing-associated H-X9-DG protein